MSKYHNERGAEVSDQTAVEVPLGWKRPESTEEMMRRIVKGALDEQARELGFETFEQSDDFATDDVDDLPFSQHELTDMQEQYIKPRRVKKPAKPEVDNGADHLGGVDGVQADAGKAGKPGSSAGRKGSSDYAD